MAENCRPQRSVRPPLRHLDMVALPSTSSSDEHDVGGSYVGNGNIDDVSVIRAALYGCAVLTGTEHLVTEGDRQPNVLHDGTQNDFDGHHDTDTDFNRQTHYNEQNYDDVNDDSNTRNQDNGRNHYNGHGNILNRQNQCDGHKDFTNGQNHDGREDTTDGLNHYNGPDQQNDITDGRHEPELLVSSLLDLTRTSRGVSTSPEDSRVSHFHDSPQSIEKSAVVPMPLSTESTTLRKILKIVTRMEQEHNNFRNELKDALITLARRFDSVSGAEYSEKPECLPLRKISQLQKYENCTEEEHNRVIHYLSSLGGTDPRTCAFIMIKEAIHDKLAPKINFYGRHEGTSSLENTKLIKGIYNFVCRCYE
ncbi:uncharacterized protein [Venturia canescens]|uniref:uncharacterized protein isoform X2 n=1 Tax=Venturia canescens TaxID=32260 RepID=UPI001C9C72D1|nr:uncharacterized protein LOC122414242 isoform X2 [Venturia canescens]